MRGDKGEKKTSVPTFRRRETLTYQHVRGTMRRGDDTLQGVLKQPVIRPEINELSITNLPPQTFLEEIPET